MIDKELEVEQGMASKLRDLLKGSSTGENALGQSDGRSVPTQRRREVQDFLNQVAQTPAATQSGQAGRLIFALDATASREPTWDRAMQLQASMFSETQALGGLQVQLCYFRGYAEFYASPWCRDAALLLKQMTGIRCEAGMTKIERLLRHAVKETRSEKVHALVYIGDCVEESLDVLAQLAGELGMRGVPIFAFQEGSEPLARRVFQTMARLSKGAYCSFDGSSAEELRDLLRAVAVYASGGLRALEDFGRRAHPTVRLLGQQMQ